MPNETAFTDATTLLLAKAPLAIWFILLFLRFVDQRATTAGYRSLLGLAGLLICFSYAWSDFQSQSFSEAANSAMTIETNSSRDGANFGSPNFLLWCGSCIIFAVQTTFAIRSWLRLTPATVHSADVANVKSGKRKHAFHSDAAKLVSKPTLVEGLLVLIATGFLAYVAWTVLDRHPFLTLNASRAANTHLFATLLMLSISVFCALETTILLSPDTAGTKDERGVFLVRWHLVAWLAQALFLIKMILTTLVLLKLGDVDAVPAPTQALAAGFAIGLIILDFVAWMVPYRLRNFQRGSQPTGWASLALASWLSVISYITISVLPFDWPWQIFWS